MRFTRAGIADNAVGVLWPVHHDTVRQAPQRDRRSAPVRRPRRSVSVACGRFVHEPSAHIRSSRDARLGERRAPLGGNG